MSDTTIPKDALSVEDVAAKILDGLYYCDRVWEAWQYGTMREDDFFIANEDDNIMSNTISAIESYAAERERIAREETVKKFANALTPSAETKAAFIGEFTFSIPDVDEDGEEVARRVTVPWTTVKEIMAAIRKHAAKGEGNA